MVFVTWMSEVQKTLVELTRVNDQEWAPPRPLFLRLGEEPECARGGVRGSSQSLVRPRHWGWALTLDHDQQEGPGCCRWRHEGYHRAAEGAPGQESLPLVRENRARFPRAEHSVSPQQTTAFPVTSLALGTDV